MSHDFVGKEFQVGLSFFPLMLMDIAWRYSAGWSVSATLVVMARRLGLTGTSSRARNHRTQKHQHGCFMLVWHLTWCIRAPRECSNVLEWKLQAFPGRSPGKPGSFLPGFICHECHWGQHRLKEREIRCHLSVRTRKELVAIFNLPQLSHQLS